MFDEFSPWMHNKGFECTLLKRTCTAYIIMCTGRIRSRSGHNVNCALPNLTLELVAMCNYNEKWPYNFVKLNNLDFKRHMS